VYGFAGAPVAAWGKTASGVHERTASSMQYRLDFLNMQRLHSINSWWDGQQ